MPFDFPNSPSIGQRVTGVGGIVYVWDGVKWTNSVGGVTVQSMGDVGRNLIHNPLFNVAQRGAGPWTSGSFTYTADRWQLTNSLDVVSASVSAMADGHRAAIGDEAAKWYYSNTFTGNAGAGAYNFISQPIEDVRRLAGKTVTVSFYAFASAALKLGVSLSQIFGIGGSPSATVNVNGQSVTLTTNFARYSLTFSVPSASGKTLGTNGNDNTQLWLWYSCGATNAVQSGNVGVQSGTTNIWGVQLEIGSVATPLEKPDPRYDLSNCQRFFQGTVTCSLRANAPTGGGTFDCTVSWPAMRALPTTVLAALGTVSANAIAATLTPVTNGGGRFECNFNSGGDSYALGQIFTLSADL